jgi:formylglycine-generating enzyme required for sulfatase activity
MFLDATGYEKVPEFLDNPDYALPDQPVVGVTRADAEAFAAWLSSVMGSKVRLPTEAEWEKAAKAGRNVVFPWGDEDAVDGIRANYRGNGKFKAPSPVGAFPNGANPWGMHDMAGNVWELVAPTANEPQVAKGGSWMEGPNDLRISNKREVDPAKTYADVGFRVVMEVKK